MFYTEKKPKSHQIGFLQKRLAHALSKKLEISCWFVSLFFSCWHMYKTFLDVLDRKEAFLEIENAWVFM